MKSDASCQIKYFFSVYSKVISQFCLANVTGTILTIRAASQQPYFPVTCLGKLK